MCFIKIMDVSFGASFVSNAIIKTRVNNSSNEYENKTSAFVELNPQDINDINALNDVVCIFEQSRRKGNNYADAMRKDFNKVCVEPENKANKRFFALTNQQDTFEYLDGKKVLGTVETSEKGNSATIKFLHVDPKINYFSNNRNTKGVGNAILDSLTNLFKNKDIYVLPDYKAVDFYSQYGFVPTQNVSRVLVYRQHTQPSEQTIT